jgi:hypothetical protein
MLFVPSLILLLTVQNFHLIADPPCFSDETHLIEHIPNCQDKTVNFLFKRGDT